MGFLWLVALCPLRLLPFLILYQQQMRGISKPIKITALADLDAGFVANSKSYGFQIA